MAASLSASLPHRVASCAASRAGTSSASRRAAGLVGSDPQLVAAELDLDAHAVGPGLPELAVGRRVDQLVPGVLELLDALDLEQLDDVVVVDADRGQVVEHLLRVGVVARDGVAPDDAVVGDRVEVASGIVLTVPGATSSTTYIVSSYAGSLTPVDAHSGRCGLAPAGGQRLPAVGRKTFS